MKEIRSLTVSMELIERLRPLICCSDTEEICRDDGFCGSSQEEWPLVPNGVAKTRLTYPEDEKKPSIPDVQSFCSDYLSWYAKTNCGALAKDIARSINAQGSCPASAEAKEYMNRIARRVPRQERDGVERLLKEQQAKVIDPMRQQCEAYEKNAYSLQVMLSERCGIMYDKDEDGNLRLNGDRADGLGDIAAFCQQVEFAEAEKISWKSFGGGGAATAGGFGLLYYASKILKALKGVKDIDESTVGAARGLKRFFSFSLPNLGRSLGYAFSLKWLRGEKPPPEIPDPTAPAQAADAKQKIEIHLHQNGQVSSAAEAPNGPLADGAAAFVADDVSPSPDVVVAQFANLLQSKRYSKDGERFAGLSENAQRYLASDIIDKWNHEATAIRQLFIKDDSRPLYGKIPIGYLLKFSRRYLKPEMLPLIEVSAKDWAKTGQLKSSPLPDSADAGNFSPTIDDVYRQLIYDDRYARASSSVQEYLARKAIAQWEEFPRPDRNRFISEKDRPDDGALPRGFIRFFRKKMLGQPKELELQAATFLQILHEVPELAGISFSIIDRRATLLINAWGVLSDAVQEAFWIQDGFMRLPHEAGELPSTFLQHMGPALKVGVLPRQTILPTNEPWKPEDSPPFSYRSFDLRAVMSAIVSIDENAAYYPTLLGQRARSMVDAWVGLAPGIRSRFADKRSGDLQAELSSPSETHIPGNFIALWYSASPGIGFGSREAEADREETYSTAPGAIGKDSEVATSKAKKLGGIIKSGEASNADDEKSKTAHGMDAEKVDILISGAGAMTAGQTSTAAVPIAPATANAKITVNK